MRFGDRPGHANLHRRRGRLYGHNRRLAAVSLPFDPVRRLRHHRTVVIVCGGPSSDQGCPRRPVIATIDVLRMPSEQRIATLGTDNRGHFRRNLPPGTHELRACTSSQLVWARVVTIRVLPHRTEHTTITFAPRHPLPVAPEAASG